VRTGFTLSSYGFLSPVFDVERVKEAAWKGLWQSKPVLVFSGLRDDRVPADYVRDQAAALQRGGGQVQIEFVEDADHFLFFSHREQTIERLTSWLAETVSFEAGQRRDGGGREEMTWGARKTTRGQTQVGLKFAPHALIEEGP